MIIWMDTGSHLWQEISAYLTELLTQSSFLEELKKYTKTLNKWKKDQVSLCKVFGLILANWRLVWLQRWNKVNLLQVWIWVKVYLCYIPKISLTSSVCVCDSNAEQCINDDSHIWSTT